ncbi:nose resistant to fluoxetine protein 6 [Drosophila elegans]|uniref:nose resistant to fluoxetine protein 6 n=1 Tax=Drosophila elegans TaxID=30023 RepID=UPI0007E84EA7|nr:nose resistant to fluoxetine protein 6 [Drosophila elegans]XP_041565244.1 nose resistant to fluoxetine protein 6 [Drosophila elegans]
MARTTVVLLIFGLAVSSALDLDPELNGDIELGVREYQRLNKLRHLPEEFFSHYQNVTLEDLVPEGRLPTVQDLQCYAEFTQLTAGLATGSLWAFRMIDSWGSVPAGILKGHLKDLGHYDECVAIEQTLASSHTLLGKYCLANLPLQPLMRIGVQTAVCFPASCSASNMDTLLRRVLKQLVGLELSDNQTLVRESTCKTSEREAYDAVTIFTIVLLSVFGGVVALATLYDYFLCEDQKKLPALLKAFSARANSRSLFRITTEPNPNVIECLHGIRGMSLIWVCLGHDYVIGITSPNINMYDVYTWAKTPFMNIIYEGVFAVDSFFFISGMLVAMVALRSMERAKGKLNIPLMYLHRYLRLTPILAVSILLYLKLLPLMGDGPLFGNWNFDSYDSCNDNWYWTLLYIQNYAADQQCLVHAWYLAIDMQLYILAPVLLIIVYKWGKKGAAVILLLLLALAAYLFGTMVINNNSLINSGGREGPDDYTDDLSHYTHNRASGWLVGFLFGYFLHTIRGKTIQLSRPAIWLGWITCLVLLLTCIFAMYPYAKANAKTLPILNEAFYVSLSRIAWPLGLSWVVFACMQGYGGLANSFLTSPLWQPVSKLSFCIYLGHLLIQNLNGGRTRVNTYFSNYDIMLRFWQDFGFSVLLAYVMYILIEAPCGGLESLILPNRRPAPQPKLQPAESSLEPHPSPADVEKQAPDPVNGSATASAPSLECKTELQANEEKEGNTSS